MDNYLKMLSERLARVEREVSSIRQELTELALSGADQQTNAQKDLTKFWADKELHRSLMNSLFAELHIEGQPIGAEKLQELMEKAGLEPNELSRDLIKAREE
jgi:predicted transcriptional regulator